MAMGEGAVINVSLRQKINTKVHVKPSWWGVNNCISSVLWLLYFVQAQGHDAKWARIYQDNQSAILIEKNDEYRASGGLGTSRAM